MEEMKWNCEPRKLMRGWRVEIVTVDVELLQYLSEHNRLSSPVGTEHFFCRNCEEQIWLGEKAVVNISSKRTKKVVFCSPLCQRQFILDVFAKKKSASSEAVE